MTSTNCFNKNCLRKVPLFYDDQKIVLSTCLKKKMTKTKKKLPSYKFMLSVCVVNRLARSCVTMRNNEIDVLH